MKNLQSLVGLCYTISDWTNYALTGGIASLRLSLGRLCYHDERPTRRVLSQGNASPILCWCPVVKLSDTEGENTNRASTLPNSGILLPSLGNCYATTVPSITEQGEKWNELEVTIWDVKMCEIYNQWNFISGLSIGAFMGMVFGIIIEKLFRRLK